MSKPFITGEQLDELLDRAEKSKSATVILRMDQFRDLVEQAKCARTEVERNEIIEECARAVEDAGGDNEVYHAKAVRALKNSPDGGGQKP